MNPREYAIERAARFLESVDPRVKAGDNSDALLGAAEVVIASLLQELGVEVELTREGYRRKSTQPPNTAR